MNSDLLIKYTLQLIKTVIIFQQISIKLSKTSLWRLYNTIYHIWIVILNAKACLLRPLHYYPYFEVHAPHYPFQIPYS